MRVLLDQNIPREIGSWLAGVRPQWQVSHVAEEGLAGAPDVRIFEAAQVLEAVICTYDEHFTDSRLFSLPHAGVVRLNVWPTTVEATREALLRLMRQVPEGELRNSIVVVDRNRIRIRRR